MATTKPFQKSVFLTATYHVHILPLNQESVSATLVLLLQHVQQEVTILR